jgi:Rrf2 family transcriptional regulator, nitric oxide-sensitive transcriptional repressor
MQLSRFTDYALRALMYLGLHRDRTVTIAEIAATFRISENHLMKIVHQLARQGYIDTARGKGGGMRLARAPDDINIGALVRDTEDNMNVAECFDPANRQCALLPACKLKSVLHEASNAFLATLDRQRLSDLLPAPESAKARTLRAHLAS